MPDSEILIPVEPEDDGADNARPNVEQTIEGWWPAYRDRLRGSLTETALKVVGEDAELIASAAMPQDHSEADEVMRWPDSRVRTGLVVGSVQSGKTASMMAVMAKLLDNGADIVLILGGTRIALWLQTYERLLRDLDGTDITNYFERNSQRGLIPSPPDLLAASDEITDPKSYLSGAKSHAERTLAAGKPIIGVVPKIEVHLRELGFWLAKVLSSRRLRDRDQPVRLVVFDDECDDASILDAADSDKVTPRAIQMIWADAKRPEETRSPLLYATYLGYTATPAANFLQTSHNPLAPRFCLALRVPAGEGSLDPRETTYKEPKGFCSYYSGGRIFYEGLRDRESDLCRPYPAPIANAGETESDTDKRASDVRWQMIGDAMRAYLVGGAIRLAWSGKKLSKLRDLGETHIDAIKEALPKPHSLMYHPSALREIHEMGAAELIAWSSCEPGAESKIELEPIEPDELRLSVEGLRHRLATEEAEWKDWVERFAKSVDRWRAAPGTDYQDPRELDWTTVRQLLVDEVFPHVQLRILNSDHPTRPSFEIHRADSGDLYQPPQDVYSIFVAGDVLSRGLTVEGLCISLFLRTSREPAADTQMQMQRWFGYRGPHLPLCRLMVFEDQLALFAEYHDKDEAHKRSIINGMNASQHGVATDPLVLEGEGFVSTRKVDRYRTPLHPGPSPTIKLVEHKDQELIAGNLKALHELIDAGDWQTTEAPAGTVRGLRRTEPLTMLEVADLLDRFRHSEHDPGIEDEFGAYWQRLKEMVESDEPLFRPPNRGGCRWLVNSKGCPYSIAAYLRFWDAALSKVDLPGFLPTDARNRWPSINQRAYEATKPRFHVGIRYGDAGKARDPRLADRGVHLMKRGLSDRSDALLKTLWGTRGKEGGYYGDEFIDYHWHGERPVPALHSGDKWRPRGHSGLVLLHVIRMEKVDAVAIGLGIPKGGPDHIAALRSETPRPADGDSE